MPPELQVAYLHIWMEKVFIVLAFVDFLFALDLESLIFGSLPIVVMPPAKTISKIMLILKDFDI